MTLGVLAAIRAIVAVAHPRHHLLTVIDAEMDRLRAEEDRCQTEVTTVEEGAR